MILNIFDLDNTINISTQLNQTFNYNKANEIEQRLKNYLEELGKWQLSYNITGLTTTGGNNLKLVGQIYMGRINWVFQDESGTNLNRYIATNVQTGEKVTFDLLRGGNISIVGTPLNAENLNELIDAINEIYDESQKSLKVYSIISKNYGKDVADTILYAFNLELNSFPCMIKTTTVTGPVVIYLANKYISGNNIIIQLEAQTYNKGFVYSFEYPISTESLTLNDISYKTITHRFRTLQDREIKQDGLYYIEFESSSGTIVQTLTLYLELGKKITHTIDIKFKTLYYYK